MTSSDPLVETITALRNEGATWADIGERLNMTEDAVRGRYRRRTNRKTVVEPPNPESQTDEMWRDSPITLDDYLAATKVDLTVWEIERWVGNKWDMGSTVVDKELSLAGGVASGFISHKGVVTTPLWQIKVWFRPKDRGVVRMQKLTTALLEDIRTITAAANKLGAMAYPRERAPYLFEYSPFDLHLGKLAWGEETTGASYDMNIATDLFRASLEFLHEKALRLSDGSLDRILCVFGNDAMHVDSKRGDTTAGTQMDFDSRYIKVYRRLVSIHRRAVDFLRRTAPVDVVIVPGNHDELTAFHMGEVLSAVFEGLPDVKVNNGPSLRKYYEYGVNLFGFTHGDSERVTELPLVMAREAPELWARCPSREWHIGHLHKADEWQDRKKPMIVQDLSSDKGIRIRRLTSLSGHDAWHVKHAFLDRRACEGFLFHKTAGFTDHMSFNIDHFTGRVLSV